MTSDRAEVGCLTQAFKMFENMATIISYHITHSCISMVCSSSGILSLLLLTMHQISVLFMYVLTLNIVQYNHAVMSCYSYVIYFTSDVWKTYK